VGAAWAAAHYLGPTAAVLPPDQHEAALGPLPIEALRLAPDAVGKLRQLALGPGRPLQAPPRDPLPPRFGAGGPPRPVPARSPGAAAGVAPRHQPARPR